MRTRILLGLGICFVWALGGSSQENQILALNLPNRGESWRLQTHLVSPAEDSIQTFGDWVENLGSPSFESRNAATRQLLNSGPRARPFLREALQSPDPEIRLRSREILAQIPRPPSSFEVRSWLVPTSRSGPPLHLLLNLLETIEDEGLRPAVHEWIVQHYPTNSIPKGLTTTRSGRLLASYVAGSQSQDLPTLPGSEEQSEETILIAYHQGMGFLQTHDSGDIRELVHLTPCLPLCLAWQLESKFLHYFPQAKQVSLVGNGSHAERAKAVSFWKEEWKKQKQEGTARELHQSPSLWVCEYDGAQGGRVFRLGKDSQPLDMIGRLQGPNDIQQLPGNRLLIAERNSCLITERDQKGNILWQWQAPSAPIQCQRLEGGLTFYATFNEIGTVDPTGKTDWTLPISEGIRFAKVTPDFEILVLTSRGTMMRLDPIGRQTKVFSNRLGSTGSGYWGHLIPRQDGSLIACFAGTHLVIQFNAEGQVIRQVSVKSPVHIKELPGGGLLVCSFDQKCLVELDSAWAEVRRIPLEGRPFALAGN